MEFNLEGILAIGLSLSIPIVAILMVFISSMKKKKHETDLRLALIQAGTDADTAKILIEDQERKDNKYGTLRTGSFFAGAGLGAVCNALCGVSADDIYFWMTIVGGVGVGLLIAFTIEYKLSRKEQKQKEETL
ncbi:MAG: hypothetical protein IJK15_00475 [Bacteroidaceae bacterium]|nr:hypothetical protein [Bacteroidaceae bacterium]